MCVKCSAAHNKDSCPVSCHGGTRHLKCIFCCGCHSSNYALCKKKKEAIEIYLTKQAKAKQRKLAVRNHVLLTPPSAFNVYPTIQPNQPSFQHSSPVICSCTINDAACDAACDTCPTTNRGPINISSGPITGRGRSWRIRKKLEDDRNSSLAVRERFPWSPAHRQKRNANQFHSGRPSSATSNFTLTNE